MALVEEERQRCAICGAEGGNCRGDDAHDPERIIFQEWAVDRPTQEIHTLREPPNVHVFEHVWIDVPAPTDPSNSITVLKFPTGSQITVSEAIQYGVPLLDVNGNAIEGPSEPTDQVERQATPVQRNKRIVETQDVRGPRQRRRR